MPTQSQKALPHVNAKLIPTPIVALMIGICIIPMVLNLLGFSFAISKSDVTPTSVAELNPQAFLEASFRFMSGPIVHSLFEWSGVIVSCITVLLAFIHFSVKKEAIVPVIGVALFCSGCVDAFHTLATDRLITGFADMKTLIPFSWVVSRIFNSTVKVIGVSLVLFFSQRSKSQLSLRAVLIVSFFLALLCYSVVTLCARSTGLPTVLFPDATIKRPYDFGVLIFFVVVGIPIFWKVYKQNTNYFTHALMVSLVPDIVTQLHMSFGSGALYDNHFIVGHFTKVVSYLIPTIGICLDYLSTYREEALAKVSLQQHSFELEKAHQKLSEMNINLERLVDQRTAQVQEEMGKVSALLDNMKQGVFTVTADGIIAAPVSKYCEAIFGVPIVGQDIFKIVYKNIAPGSEKYSVLKSTIMTVYGGDLLQYELEESNLLRSVTLADSNQDLRIIYAPIWNREGNLEKLLFIVEDVTEINRIEKKIAEERRIVSKNILMIEEIVSRYIESIKNFLVSSNSKIKECNELIPRVVTDRVATDNDARNNFKRNLHTLKGNARVLGLKSISETVHQAEGDLVAIYDALISEKKAGELSPEQIMESIRILLRGVSDTLDGYVHVLQKFFKVDVSAHDPVNRNKNKVSIQLSNLDRLEKAISLAQQNSPHSKVDEIVSAFSRLGEAPLVTEFNEFEGVLKEVATKLGKKIEFKAAGDDVSLTQSLFLLIYDAVGHLLRNAVDHGIEAPEARIKKGKSEKGTIQIHCSQKDHKVLIKISDDGQGIDTQAVGALAVKKKLVSEDQLKKMSEQDRLKLILLPDFSTRNVVSEISGRGMGGSVVKANIEKLKGNILIHSQLNRGTEFEISFMNQVSSNSNE